MNMDLKSITLLTALILTSNVDAATLTFDDVPDGSIQNSFGDMPTDGGYDFSFTLDWIDVVDSSWDYGAHSGDFALVNNKGGIGTITEIHNADFTFDGLWAKKWGTATDSAGEDSLFGNISGYNDGKLIWSVLTGLNGSYEYYGAQTGAIDELKLDLGDVFLVDDITLNGVSSVPIPPAAWLFVSGIIGLAGVARRRA